MARILVAEDDQFTLEMIKRALETDGHDVTTAENGAEAMTAIESGPSFDLVMTDVDMPQLSGIALAEDLIARDAGQRMIIMSGIADELSRAGAIASSTVRIVTKPVTLERIRTEATEILACNP